MVNINKTKRNFIWWYILFAIISGVLGVVILRFVLLGRHFGGCPLIPTYFYFFGLFSIYASDAYRWHAPRRTLLLYSAAKMIRMIFSLILVLIYCPAVCEEAKAFLLALILFYLIYLVSETWFFFFSELNQKRKRENKKKNETVA